MVASALVAMAAVASCATTGVEAPAPPPLRALPGRTATSSAVLQGNPGALDGLAQPLAGLGFVAGRERVYTGEPGSFERIVTRALAFDGPDGATGYLAWIARHADALLGTSTPAQAPAFGEEAIAFRHDPGGCCPGKDFPAFVVAWRTGGVVVFVLARGRRMTLQRAESTAAVLGVRS
jgi:hypothetical protein